MCSQSSSAWVARRADESVDKALHADTFHPHRLKRKPPVNTPITSLMSSPVFSVSMDDTVQTIEALMSQHKLSWLPVIEPEGAPVGVIALSDLLQFHIRNQDPAVVCAWQICHYKPISVSADASMIDVARVLRNLDQDGYVVPRPHPELVTRRVLVMERLNGFNFDDVVGMQDDTRIGVVSALDFVRRFVLDAE